MENMKFVVVGDGAVGKTSLLISFVENVFASDYIPTVFDNYAKQMVVDDKIVSLQLWDTAGQEDYDRIRPLSYPNTHVFIVCFSVTSISSIENAKSKWVPEIMYHTKNEAVILLVGTKSDRRKDSAFCVEDIYAERVAKEIKAIGYQECSAMTQEGVQNVFTYAVQEARRIQLNKERNNPMSCCSMQ